MITLDLLKLHRLAANLTRNHLAHLTGIDEPRLREIELRTCEPWFDETMKLHRILGTVGVLQLITSDNPTTLAELDEPLPYDEHAWRHGARAPLSLAVRIAARFGLPDPAELVVSPRIQQIWDVIQSTERFGDAGGWCPWCIAAVGEGKPHLPTCLANNLLSPHTCADQKIEHVLRPPRGPGRKPSMRAKGLKAPRIAAGMTQKQVAEYLGMSSNHYARMERGELPLSIDKADTLAAFYNVYRASLYAEPTDNVPPVPAILHMTGSLSDNPTPSLPASPIEGSQA